MATSEHLEALKEIVPRLPRLNEVVADTTKGVGIQYQVDGEGACFAFEVYASPHKSVAVARTYISDGAWSPVHVHDHEIETFILYAGEGRVEIAGVVHPLVTGVPCHVLAGVPHRFGGVSTCWTIVITAPSASGFPGVT